MGRAGDGHYAVSRSDTRHFERNLDVFCPIVDPRQNMAMQIDQSLAPEGYVTTGKRRFETGSKKNRLA
jgi:hypothetical protein